MLRSEFTLYSGPVKPDWIDYNGHMNDACYVRVFSLSIDEFMLRIGLTPAFREQNQVSLYTLQSMVHYLNEVGLGEPLQVDVQVLERDSKKIRLYFVMKHGSSGVELAAMETLLLHVDMQAHRAAPFLGETSDLLDRIQQKQSDWPWPPQAGKGIALRRTTS